MTSTTTERFLYSPLAEEPDLAELVQDFVAEVPMRLAALESSIHEQNWAGVAKVAHQMKGAAGSYGFGDVTPFAKRLEDKAKAAGPETEILAAAEEMIAICSRLRAGLPE